LSSIILGLNGGEQTHHGARESLSKPSEYEAAGVVSVVEYNSIGGERGGRTWLRTGRRIEIEL